MKEMKQYQNNWSNQNNIYQKEMEDKGMAHHYQISKNQKEGFKMTTINTGSYAMYGQLEELANGNADIEAFVFRDGKVVPVSEEEGTSNPGIHTAQEKNYAI